MQKILGGDQFLRAYSECLGRADQIGFVIGEKFESAGEDCWITKTGPQTIGIKPGQFKIARRALLAFQHPAERSQRQSLRVDRIGGGAKRDCPVLRARVVMSAGDRGAM